jgi:hypothetical protein
MARTVSRGGAARTAARTVARGEEGEGEDGAPAMQGNRAMDGGVSGEDAQINNGGESE